MEGDQEAMQWTDDLGDQNFFLKMLQKFEQFLYYPVMLVG